MRLRVALAGVAVAVASLRAAQPQAARFEIVPGERFGPIRESTTRAELVRFFGGGAVIDRPVAIGEGFCTPGTVVLPGTPNEIEVGWQDQARTRVAFVVTSKPGDWKTRRGVRVGTLLTELESIAGQVLTFSGFGWDYGGGMNWTEGGGSLRLELGPEEGSMTAAVMGTRDIFGDREVRSDHPLIRKLKIRVNWLRQDWGRHFENQECG